MRHLIGSLAGLIAIGVLAGCGSGSGTVATAPVTAICHHTVCATTLHITTSAQQLAFVPTHLTAPEGRITIVMTDTSSIDHSVAIDAPGAVPGQIVNPGQVSTTTATLGPGSYQYYCTVPGHREAGMVGTLTVTG